ncbi:MAG: tail protein X [Oligoflexales bacterium]
MDYICSEGDRIDLICFKVYGNHDNGIIARVLTLNTKVLTELYIKFTEHNQGFYDGVLPEGLKLILPELSEISPKKPVRRLF